MASLAIEDGDIEAFLGYSIRKVSSPGIFANSHRSEVAGGIVQRGHHKKEVFHHLSTDL